MNEWLENYRPVRQRTVRRETTKDKAGALPPAVSAHGNPKVVIKAHFPADQVNITPTASLENRSVVDEECAISFVSDTTVLQLKFSSEADFNQVEEYESDSDCSDVNSKDFDLEELVNSKPVITRVDFHYTKISGNFCPNVDGTVWTRWKFSGQSRPPPEVILFDRSVGSHRILSFHFQKFSFPAPLQTITTVKMADGSAVSVYECSVCKLQTQDVNFLLMHSCTQGSGTAVHLSFFLWFSSVFKDKYITRFSSC